MQVPYFDLTATQNTQLELNAWCIALVLPSRLSRSLQLFCRQLRPARRQTPQPCMHYNDPAHTEHGAHIDIDVVQASLEG